MAKDTEPNIHILSVGGGLDEEMRDRANTAKNSKLSKFAKRVKEAGAKMKMNIKKIGREKKKPKSSSGKQTSWTVGTMGRVGQWNSGKSGNSGKQTSWTGKTSVEKESWSGSPGFKIYEDWEPFQMNIGRSSSLNDSHACEPWSRKDCFEKKDVMWRFQFFGTSVREGYQIGAKVISPLPFLRVLENWTVNNVCYKRHAE